MAKRVDLSKFILIISCCLAIYAVSLFNGFVYDDSVIIVNNLFIKDIGNLKHLFYNEYFDSKEMTYRPVVTATYICDYFVWGLNPFGFHLTNLFLHSLNASLLYILLQYIEKKTALIAAFLFLLHPALTEAVNGISFREDLLVFSFYLTSLILYLSGTRREERRRFISYLGSCISFFLALLSKEMAITLPLMIIALDIYRGYQGLNLRRYIGYVAITAFYLYLRFFLFYSPMEQEFLNAPPLSERLLQLPAILGQHLRLLLFPINLSVEYPWRIGHTWIQIFGLSAVGLTVTSLLWLRRKACLWGLFWILITLIPVYNVYPIYNPFAERYLYLPMLGFSMIQSSIFRRQKEYRKILGCLLLFYAMLAVERNTSWKDDLTIWSDAVKKTPASGRTHAWFGMSYASKGMMREAIQEYKKAIQLMPYDPIPYNALGLAYYKEGMVKEAVIMYEKALEIAPKHRDARYNLALLYHEQGQIEEAIKQYKEILRRDGKDFDVLNSLGYAYFQKGIYGEAVSQYKKALDVNPDPVGPYNNLGMLYAVTGQTDEAALWFKKGLSMDPKSAETYYNLGLMYQRMGSPGEAREAYKKALEIMPGYKEARKRLEEVQ